MHSLFKNNLNLIRAPGATFKFALASEELAVGLDPSSLKIPRGTPADFFLNAAPVVFIGVGELKMIRNDVLSGMPDGLAVAVTERWKRDAPSMNGVISEQVFMQNLPSACVPHALAPAENDLVIDLCAAPGGKTTHIAQLMNNKGLVVALDRSYKKVKKIIVMNLFIFYIFVI